MRDLVREAGYLTATTTDFGVNVEGNDPLALRRVTARHTSRNWRNAWAWLAAWMNGGARCRTARTGSQRG